MMRRKSLTATAVGLLLSACASVVGTSQSEVMIRTNPNDSRCDLKGRDFNASIQTPAAVTIPHSASPVTVNCIAPGFRPTSFSLEAKAGNWIWGNSALFAATGGIALLGALFDESRGAGRNFAEEVNYDLTPDRRRDVNVRTRTGDVDLQLQAR
jgi:hypothetical protein